MPWATTSPLLGRRGRPEGRASGSLDGLLQHTPPCGRTVWPTEVRIDVSSTVQLLS